MTTVADTIINYFPAEGDVSVPLSSTIWILFNKELNETELSNNFFIEGPDTDTFVGPDYALQEYPNNVSQGDDFLTSPGYKGIVQGTITYKKIDTTDLTTEVESSPYYTKLIFTPTHPMAALTEYKACLPEVTDLLDNTYEGYVTFSWTTGTGSIQALPSTGSTSVLMLSGSPSTTVLNITKTTPQDHQVQVNPELSEIIIEFDQTLNPNTVTADKISIKVEAATDHPHAITTVVDEVFKSVTVEDNKVIINI